MWSDKFLACKVKELCSTFYTVIQALGLPEDTLPPFYPDFGYFLQSQVISSVFPSPVSSFPTHFHFSSLQASQFVILGEEAFYFLHAHT